MSASAPEQTWVVIDESDDETVRARIIEGIAAAPKVWLL
jgi:hypothetical protein